MNMTGLPIQIKALLLTQMLFNIGFYLVVPFIAVQLSENLGAAGAVVGLVLGIRTFSQQGLFFLGGGLADRFGPAPILLIGVFIRVLGFLAVGLAGGVTSMTFGVVLIGFAAALFSPAVEAIFATSGLELEREGVITRAQLFALDAAYSRVGSLTGPLLGAVLIPLGFSTVSFAGAAIFAVIFAAHAVLWRRWSRSEASVAESGITSAVSDREPASMVAAWARVIRNRRFIVFAILYSTYLLAYNQQYLALPVELRRATGSDELLGWFFALAAVFVIALQTYVTRWVEKRGATMALGGGFTLMALSFALVAVAAPFRFEGWLALVPATLLIIFLHSGIMLAVPIARDLVGDLAENKDLGSYYGFLNSFGGVAVLLGSVLIGSALDWAETPSPWATVPWLIMTVLLAASAFGLVKLRRSHREERMASNSQEKLKTKV